MIQRYVPVWVRHAPSPSLQGFALLTGLEATVRGMVVSVYPLLMYRAYGDAALVSRIYLGIGVASLCAGLMAPWLTRFIPRRFVFTGGACLFLIAQVVAIFIGGKAIAASVLLSSAATVVVFTCYNAYVLDYIERIRLSECESLRMTYSALAWTTGPLVGVWLMNHWAPAPFVVSGLAALGLLGQFWRMRLGDGKLIARAKGPAPNPLAFLPRFFAQPRLIAGWLFAVIRSCGWWIYVVYLPIFAVEAGLADWVGGALLSVTNATLFASSFLGRWVRRASIRKAVRTGFFMSGLLFAGAGLLASAPVLALGLLYCGSVFLILLDACGGLPFLMAVKPSERTEMSAVYATFRDVSGILTPGVAALALTVAPLSSVFALGGAGLFVAWAIAGGLHPRLGGGDRAGTPAA